MTPECAYCGRQHGTRPPAAPLQHPEWGKPRLDWIWLDEEPPERIKKAALRLGTLRDGKTWRCPMGGVHDPPDPSLPQAREEIQLTRWTFDDYEEWFTCDHCAAVYRDETEFNGEYCEHERLPLPHVAPKEQLALL